METDMSTKETIPPTKTGFGPRALACLEMCVSNPSFYFYILSFVTFVLCFVLLFDEEAYLISANFKDSDDIVKIGYLRWCLYTANEKQCSWVTMGGSIGIDTSNLSQNATTLASVSHTFQTPILVTTTLVSMICSIILIIMTSAIINYPHHALIRPHRLEEFHPVHRDNVPFLVLTRRGLTTVTQTIGFFTPLAWCALAISSYISLEAPRSLARVTSDLELLSGRLGFSILWTLSLGAALLQFCLYLVLLRLVKHRASVQI